MLRVTWPVTAMATRSGTPARTMLRAAVRRRSWNSLSGTPAAREAVAQAFLKSPTGSPSRWNTSAATRMFVSFWNSLASQRRSISSPRSPSSMGVEDAGVRLDFSRPGKPMDNPFIESFNGRLRDEHLNTELFFSVADASAKLLEWQRVYK